MMNNKIDIKKLKAAAKKLGLKVETNSKNPGFSFNETGKIYSWEEIAESVRERFKKEPTKQYNLKSNLFELESPYKSTLYRQYSSKQNMTSINFGDKNVTFFQLKDSLELNRSHFRINRKTLKKNNSYRDNAIPNFKKDREYNEASYFKNNTIANTYINTNI